MTSVERLTGEQTAATPPGDVSRAEAARRIEELGKIIMAYSEVTDQMQKSQDELQRTVAKLREELGEKNRLLERRKRLAALGEMAAGLAHEIRNPLGGIQLYASLLAGDLKEMEPQHKLVEKISMGVRRLESLVSQVLLFSREIRLDLSECELGEVVREAVELAGPRAAKFGAMVSVEVTGEVVATVDRTLIGQAVMNLVVNGAEAAGEGGSVLVRVESVGGGGKGPVTGHETGAATGPGTGAAMGAAMGAGRWKISVADSGAGIGADALDRIFNPFFSTKADGCGLGLSIVHRIAESHDGVVRATNGADGVNRMMLGGVRLGGAVFELEAPMLPPRGLLKGQVGQVRCDTNSME